MFDKKDRRLENQKLDHLGRDLIRASALSESEADQLARSPYLFRRIRARIAAGKSERRRATRWYSWAFPAAALALLIVGLNLVSLIRSPRPESPLPASTTSAVTVAPPTSDPPPGPPTLSAGPTVSLSLPHHQPDRAGNENDDEQTEITTEFLPVAYWGDPSALQRGQLLRVELPRSALRLFGLPVDETHLNHRIKADVVLSDDGLVLAIRFLI